MESEWEREIRELLDSLAREPLDELLKEIAETPIPMARKTRKREKGFIEPISAD